MPQSASNPTTGSRRRWFQRLSDCWSCIRRMVGFLSHGYRETTDRRIVMFGPVQGIDDLDRLHEDY